MFTEGIRIPKRALQPAKIITNLRSLQATIILDEQISKRDLIVISEVAIDELAKAVVPESRGMTLSLATLSKKI